MVLALFIVLKLSVYREYIFFGTYLLMLSQCFMNSTKSTTKKKKTKPEKRWLFEEDHNNYGYFAGVLIYPSI
jgi:hypothetical protein